MVTMAVFVVGQTKKRGEGGNKKCMSGNTTDYNKRKRQSKDKV